MSSALMPVVVPPRDAAIREIIWELIQTVGDGRYQIDVYDPYITITANERAVTMRHDAETNTVNFEGDLVAIKLGETDSLTYLVKVIDEILGLPTRC